MPVEHIRGLGHKLDRECGESAPPPGWRPGGVIVTNDIDVSSAAGRTRPLSAEQIVPTVSVIIPHYRDLERLDRCLTAIANQTYRSSRVEVIVADNASPEGEDVVSAVIAGRARLVVVHERGAGSARNGAVAVASGEVLAFTDSDCLPEAEWIEQGVAALQTYDIVGGRMTVLIEKPPKMSAAEAFETVFAFKNDHYVKIGFTVSANLFCARSLFLKFGGFLSAGFAEDIEWCYRARAAGFRLGYAEGCVVGHPSRRNWAELMTKWRRVNSDLYGMYALRPGGKLKWMLRSLALPISAVVHTPRVLLSPSLNSLEQRLSALGYLYRLRMWRFFNAFKLVFERRDV